MPSAAPEAATRRPPWRRAAARVMLVSTGALALYGGWATLVNWPHGADVALRAGATQGAMSFTFTALMSTLMEALFTACRPGWRRVAITCGLPLAGTVLLLVAAHALVGTPELLLTVLPSATIGSVFALVYTRALIIAERAAKGAA